MYPQLLLFISSLLSFSPLPHPLILGGISLPLLLHFTRPRTDPAKSPWTQLLTVFAISTGASTLSYLPTTLGTFPGTEAVILQVLFSSIATTAVLLPILGYQYTVRSLSASRSQRNLGTLIALPGGEDMGLQQSRSRWLELAAFPVIWTTWWMLVEQVNPFGRQGIPTPPVLYLPTPLLPLLLTLGQPGLDFLISSYSIIILHSTKILLKDPIPEAVTTAPRLPEQDGVDERGGVDLIGFEDESRAEGSLRTSPLGLHEDEERRGSEGGMLARATGGGRSRDVSQSSERSAYGTFKEFFARHPSQPRTRTRSRSIPEVSFHSLFPLPLKLFIVTTLLLTFLPATLFPLPEPLSLSSPISQLTPLPVGCILPPSGIHSLRGMVDETERYASQAKVLLWPEQALHLRTEEEREETIQAVERITKLHRIWVGIGIGSPAPINPIEDEESSGLERNSRRNELLLIGPNGIEGEYQKNNLVPLIESYSHSPGTQRPPVWTIDLPPPSGRKKPDWAEKFPFVREINISPLICADALHPSVIPPRQERQPNLILLATSPPPRTGTSELLLERARDLAVQQNAEVLICDGSGKNAQSGLFGPNGWMRYSQKGEGSFVIHTGIPYGKEKKANVWQTLGGLGSWGVLMGVVVVGLAVEQIGLKLVNGGGFAPTRRRVEQARAWVKRLLARKPREETSRLIDAE